MMVFYFTSKEGEAYKMFSECCSGYRIIHVPNHLNLGLHLLIIALLFYN